MTAQFLLDSVILIDSFNGVVPAKRWLNSIKAKDAVISVVTLAEVLTGSPNIEQDMILLRQYECLTIQPSTAEISARLRKQFKWKLMDAFQAALAIEHKLTLITRNSKDFNPKIHPFVKMPYSIA